MKRILLSWMLVLVLLFCSVPMVTAHASNYTTVDEAVAGIVAEMNAAGITGEYEQAVWLHDWLTEHAAYDFTYTKSGPDGVLLYGNGVCQSYTDAYILLLKAVGIECTAVSSKAMKHTWNLVKLNGEWCHVDVTWDDPADEGDDPSIVKTGDENHFYFGMSEELISRDHYGFSCDYPCTSIKNYYPLLNQSGQTFCNAAEMQEILRKYAEDKEEKIELIYAGSDNEFSLMDELWNWIDAEGNEKYKIMGVRGSSGNYTANLVLIYPWSAIEPTRITDYDGSTIIEAIKTDIQQGKYVVSLTGYEYGSDAIQYLDEWEAKHVIFETLGIVMVASFEDMPENEKNRYPHVQCVAYDFSDNGMLLYAAGFNGGVMPYSSFFYDTDGNCMSYQNGGLVSLNDCAYEIAEKENYMTLIPAGLTSLEEEAFAGSAFGNVDLTTGKLTTIGKRAFADCSGLRLVRIPGSVNEIGDGAFDGSDGVILICPANSTACRYAIEHGILYITH